MTSLQDATRQVLEGIQVLTSLTCGPADQLEHPVDVREVVTGLSVAVSRMPPLLGQLAAFLEVENVSGTIVRQDGNDASALVRAVSDALHRAGLDAEAMAVALDTAGISCEQLAAAGPGLRSSRGQRPTQPDARKSGRRPAWER